MSDKKQPVSWSIAVNPTNHEYLSSLDPARILAACGLIPSFVGSFQESTSEGFMDHLSRSYGHGIFTLSGGRVDKDNLTFHFPEDPTQYPYLAIVGSFDDPADDLMVLIYPHAMVAVLQDDGEKQTIFRMD